VEVGPINAQAVGRVVGLPALAALLLASLSIAFAIAASTAVTALTPGLPGGGPVPGVVTPGPDATPVRLLAQAGGHNAGELDALSGYLRTPPAVESPAAFATAAAVPDPHAPGTAGHHRGRAPPHAR
jgi:hypothetical protein